MILVVKVVVNVHPDERIGIFFFLNYDNRFKIFVLIVVHVIEVIPMIQVMIVIKNDLVVVQVVNVVDQNRNHQVKRRVVVRNVVHQDQNQKIMIMVMIEHQIIQKKAHHPHQDVNVIIVVVEIMMLIMIIKAEMKVNDE